MDEVKEIGGYFGLEQFAGKAYYDNLIALNTGRNALQFALQFKNVETLFVPYYICDTITDMLKQNNRKFEYYHIDRKFNLVFDRLLSKNDYLYIINYYGQFSNQNIARLKQKHGNIIVDNTQAFFQKPIVDVDTIYSCRKFFGVPDGAYLATNIKSADKKSLAMDISKDRMTHILGRYEKNATEYYEDYVSNERALADYAPAFMSLLTQNLLKAIDYKAVKQIRQENFKLLNKQLKSYNQIKPKMIVGPFAYPFYSKKAAMIRKCLVKKKIYIPLLWPNVLKEIDESAIEYDYAQNILPLPCDQRYGSADMQRIIDEIKTIINEKECYV